MDTEETSAAEIPEAAAAVVDDDDDPPGATAAAVALGPPPPVEDETRDEPVIFQVLLKGGSPWGFSLKGGAEHHCPLVIAKVGLFTKINKIN